MRCAGGAFRWRIQAHHGAVNRGDAVRKCGAGMKNRENNREFSDFGGIPAVLAADLRSVFSAIRANSLSTRTGNCFRGTGNLIGPNRDYIRQSREPAVGASRTARCQRMRGSRFPPRCRVPSVPLEELYRALVLLGRHARLEGAEIAPPPGLRIDLAGIEAVDAGFQFADHRGLAVCSVRRALQERSSEVLFRRALQRPSRSLGARRALVRSSSRARSKRAPSSARNAGRPSRGRRALPPPSRTSP
jgi:hypothetical protein